MAVCRRARGHCGDSRPGRAGRRDPGAPSRIPGLGAKISRPHPGRPGGAGSGYGLGHSRHTGRLRREAPGPVGRPRPGVRLAPASEGPGLLPPPRSIAYTNAQVCGAVAAKGGFSYNTYISTNAGSYPVIVVAVAVALAESGCQYNVYLCDPSLVHGYYPPVSCPAGTGSYDRGLWQINSYYHSEVSDACAFQVQCNTAAAFLISDKGRNWSAWAPYNSGAWASYISLAEQSVYGFSFQLQNHGDGTCLDADSRQPYDKGKIFQWTCRHSDRYQQWKLIGTAGNLPILQNVGTGTCLDADSRSLRQRQDLPVALQDHRSLSAVVVPRRRRAQRQWQRQRGLAQPGHAHHLSGQRQPSVRGNGHTSSSGCATGTIFSSSGIRPSAGWNWRSISSSAAWPSPVNRLECGASSRALTGGRGVAP